MPSEPTSSSDFSVHVAPGAQGGTDVAIFGELDLATADAVKRALDEAIEADGHVVIDLRACGFVDSSGIAVLIRTGVRLHELGRRLRIRGVQERVMRILELSGMTSMEHMEIEPQPPPPARA